MSKKSISPEKLKLHIIVHVFDLIENHKKEDRKKATEKLHLFAKAYSLPLKKTTFKGDLKETLRSFIINDKGYIITLSNLYNTLNN